MSRIVDALTPMFPNWNRLPVLGPDGNPFFISLPLNSFGIVTSGFSLSELNVLISKVQEDAVIIDIGAHIGVWSRKLASIARRGQVFAAEPSETTFGYLKMNTEKYDNIEAIEIAFSDTNGYVGFVENADSAAQRHLMTLSGEEESLRTVDVMRLDDWVTARKLRRLDLIKVDVEGFEEEVLSAAIETIKRFKPIIIFEFVPEMAKKRSKYKGDYLFGFLQEQGYQISRLDQSGQMHNSFHKTKLDWTSDYAAIPLER